MSLDSQQCLHIHLLGLLNQVDVFFFNCLVDCFLDSSIPVHKASYLFVLKEEFLDFPCTFIIFVNT